MKTKIITKEKLSMLLEEEKNSGRQYIDWNGEKEEDGLLFSFWTDTRSGEQFAVKEIRSVRMGFNSNEPGKEEEFVRIMEKEGACKAWWGVTGRTMHQNLAQQLAGKYPQYRFEIGYNYECSVYKKGD